MILSCVLRNARRAFSLGVIALMLPMAQAPAAPVAGEQKALVILVNFTDNTQQPQTREQVGQLVFGQVSDFYWESSYGKALFSGDTAGWFTIPVRTAECSWDKVVTEGNRAAVSSGVDISRYSHFIYMYPSAGGCVGGGGAQIGPKGEKRVFINGAAGFAVRPVAHEIGHTFGLSHADALDCGSAVVGEGCTRLGYGDGSDGMGGQGHFNAFHKEKLGWLNVEGAPVIATVSTSGRFKLAPYETAGQDTKALKVLKSVDPVSGRRTWYYVEYRQPIGFDAWLSRMGNLTTGIQVRAAYDHAGVSDSLLLDMTPGSQYYDFDDAALVAGRTYTDSTAGVTITLVSADASGAVVDVSVAGSSVPSCIRNKPSVEVVASSAAVAAGTAVGYTVTVGNQDSAGCGATGFSLAGSVPAGWVGTLGVGTMTLSPGAESNTTLTVTSPASAAPASYGVGVGVGSAAGSVHSASAGSTYTVVSNALLTSSLGTDKAVYARAETVYISARVLRDGQPVAGANVRFLITTPSGATTDMTAITGSDGFARATQKIGKGKSALGSYELRAEASDRGSTTSAGTGFSVR